MITIFDLLNDVFKSINELRLLSTIDEIVNNKWLYSDWTNDILAVCGSDNQ